MRRLEAWYQNDDDVGGQQLFDPLLVAGHVADKDDRPLRRRQFLQGTTYVWIRFLVPIHQVKRHGKGRRSRVGATAVTHPGYTDVAPLSLDDGGRRHDGRKKSRNCPCRALEPTISERVDVRNRVGVTS